jgi:hypothetical protein
MRATDKGAWIPMTEAEWAKRASRHLKAELKRAGITYDGLANLLKKQGFGNETKGSVAYKLSRGNFTKAFYLASVVAIGCEPIRPEDS